MDAIITDFPDVLVRLQHDPKPGTHLGKGQLPLSWPFPITGLLRADALVS
ncbi:hypothetical protein ABZ570_01305 [Micromonospora sp. NPDC007271]